MPDLGIEVSVACLDAFGKCRKRYMGFILSLWMTGLEERYSGPNMNPTLLLLRPFNVGMKLFWCEQMIFRVVGYF